MIFSLAAACRPVRALRITADITILWTDKEVNGNRDRQKPAAAADTGGFCGPP